MLAKVKPALLNYRASYLGKLVSRPQSLLLSNLGNLVPSLG